MRYCLLLCVFIAEAQQPDTTYFVNQKEHWFFLDKDAFKSLNTSCVLEKRLHKDSSQLKGIGAGLSIPIVEVSLDPACEPIFSNPYCTYKSINYNEARNPYLKELFVEYLTMPVFKGGPNALKNFIMQHIVLPQVPNYKQIKGRVFVHFIVEIDGTVSNVELLKGLEPTLDAAAVAVAYKLRFSPATFAGFPRASRFTLSVNFD
jgi:TonB family protein